MIVAPKFYIGHVTVTTSTLGFFVIRRLGFDIPYWCTQFNHCSFRVLLDPNSNFGAK